MSSNVPLGRKLRGGCLDQPVVFEVALYTVPVIASIVVATCPWLIGILWGLAICILIVLCISIRNELKLTAEEHIAQLNHEMEGALDLYQNLLTVLDQISQVVSSKSDRIKKLAPNQKKPNLGQIVEALSPRSQIHKLQETIYIWFQQKLEKSECHKRNPPSLRVATFVPDSRNRLIPRFAWDSMMGQKLAEDADTEYKVIKSPDDKFSLTNAASHPPEVVKIYRDPNHTLKIISNCGDEEARQQRDKGNIQKFCFFRAEQRDYLGSMLLFKHVYDQTEDGEEALIVSVDCSLPGFFNEAQEQQYRDFLVEITARLDYELAMFAAV